MFNPIVIGAILRVETVEDCNSDWERHIHLRSYAGTQFEMDIDESLDVETRFRAGDYWTTVGVEGLATGFGLIELPPAQNAELRRKDAALRAIHAQHEREFMEDEAQEVVEEMRSNPHEMTFGDGAMAQPMPMLFTEGMICAFTQGPFHPLRLLEKPARYPGFWLVRCLDHNETGLVAEEHIRHATPEETANLARKGGDGS